MNILEGIRVIEFASVLAGPQVGMGLAEMGATVKKIENKRTGGDVTRSWKTTKENSKGVSAYFCSANWGKEHVFLDLREPTDYQSILDEIASTDIVIHNFKAGDAEKLKLDYDRLKEVNPQLIYASIEGFESDPQRVAYDVVIQAETGYMYMNGQPDSLPTKMPIALMDIMAAQQLRTGILAALIQRGKTGKGCRVSASLERSAIASLANQASNYLMTGSVPERMGSLHPNIAPYGETLRTDDGKYVVLAIGSDVQFARFCSLVGLSELRADKRFENNQSRVRNRHALADLLAPAVAKFSRDNLLEQCREKNIPVAAIRNMKEVFEGTTARDQVLKETLEGKDTLRVGTIGFRLLD